MASVAARQIAEAFIKQRPDRKEIATLGVQGVLFTDWTSVRVESRVSQPFPIFQFECSEETPVPLQRVALQFMPGDECIVYLGGQIAVKGYITERHVSYDARQHGVRLIGNGDAADLVIGSVSIEQLEKNHDGQNWEQLAQDLASELGIEIRTHGAVDARPFQRVGIQPGETIMNVIERHARHRNIVIGSNFDGGLLGIGEHRDIPLGELTEGVHILKANAVIRDEGIFNRVTSIAQQPGGSNGTGGQGANQQKCERVGTFYRPRHRVVPTEISDDEHGTCRRADMEIVFTEGSEVEANITVQGWFRDNNNNDALWRANETYIINSPSLCLNGIPLACASCIYEQNAQGTTTTLQMVDPIHLNKQIDIRKALFERRRQRRIEQDERQRQQGQNSGATS